MKPVSSREVEEFLNSLSDEQRPIVLALRETILNEAPQAEESLLWGGLSYHRPWLGGRVKGAICQIVTKHRQVRLDFIHGVALMDPRELLGGKLKSKRFILIHDVATARNIAVAALIRAAAEFDPTLIPPS